MDVSLAVKIAQADAFAGMVNAAGTAGRLKLCTGVRPAPGAPETAPIVAALPLQYPCGTVGADGVLALADTAVAQILASGAVTWARLEDGNSTWVADLSAGVMPDLAANPDAPVPECILPVATFYAGSYVALVGATIGV